MAAPLGGSGGLVPPSPKRRQRLSKENGIKLVWYTFRLKNYTKIPLPHFCRVFIAGATTGELRWKDEPKFATAIPVPLKSDLIEGFGFFVLQVILKYDDEATGFRLLC